MKNSVKHRAMALCGCLVLSAAAHAQYAPDATMDLGTGYGQTALSQSVLDGTRAIGEKSSTRQSRAGAAKWGCPPAGLRALRNLNVDTPGEEIAIAPEQRQRWL